MDNNRLDNERARIDRRTVVIFAVCIALLLLVAQMEAVKNALGWFAGVLTPVFMGVVFAYILNPIYVFIDKTFLRLFAKMKIKSIKARRRISRGLGILFSVLFLLAVIALLLFLIIPEFLESFDKLLDIAPSLIQTAVDRIGNSIALDNSFGEHLGESLDTLATNLTGWIGGELSALIGGLLEGAISIVSFLFDFLISLVVLVYALLEKNRFIAQSKKIIFALFSPNRANDILAVARYGNEVFGKFISGKLLTSSIVGIVTFLFMTIMDMPYALLSAGIISITNVIPFFGPFIGGIPTAFIVLLTDVRQGIIYAVFLIVLQQLEGNVIEPLIMEDKTGVSKFWITVALLFCGGVFGLPGMIFSVPLFAVLFYCIKVAVERSLSKKSLPLSSSEYLNAGSVDPETFMLYPAPERESNRKLRDTISEWRARKKNKNDVDTDE